MEKNLEPDHPLMAQSLHNLAMLYAEQGQYDTAEPLYLQALNLRKKTLGPEHPDTLATQESYAALLSATGRDGEAAWLLTGSKSW